MSEAYHSRSAVAVTPDEIQERSMFAFEAVIELLRDTLDIESFCHAPGHLGHLQALFLFQPDGQPLQFLRQQFS